MILLTKLVVLVCAMYVVWFCICALNAMSKRTEHGMRLAIVVMATGCFFEAAQVLVPGYIPSMGEVLLCAGLAAGTAFNRRASVCPCVQVVHRHDAGANSARPSKGAPT